MTAVSRDDAPHLRSAQPGTVAPQAPARHEEPADWVLALTTPGTEQTLAMQQLHHLMIRAAAHQVWRMRAALPDPSPVTVNVIVNQAADEAMTALLAKLHTFEGRSRFTTWAFKFAILQAATEVRRLQWQHGEVELRDLDLADAHAPAHDSPEHHAEGSDLARAAADAMRTVLTPHQRRIAIALLVDGIPIDVLAQRLGTSRGALYKTVHDVRVRLRAELGSRGYLPPTTKTTGSDEPNLPRNPAGMP